MGKLTYGDLKAAEQAQYGPSGAIPIRLYAEGKGVMTVRVRMLQPAYGHEEQIISVLVRCFDDKGEGHYLNYNPEDGQFTYVRSMEHVGEAA